MTARRATQQRLDPLGTLAAWPLAPGLAAVVLCYSVIATVLQSDQVQNPLLATLAVLAMAAAAGTLVIATQPAHSPFGRQAHIVMVTLAVLGYLFEALSRWGSNELVQDDFGPISIGLLLLALAPYRPWREIALSGAIASVIAIAITLPQAGTFRIDVPVAVYAIVSVVQILAPAAAGAAYSRRVVTSILAWQTDARRAIVARTEEARGQLARAVVEQQVTALKSGVIPFLTDVLERGTVTALDIAQAGQLAAEVRRTLVAEIDRTWLDSVVTRERAALAERGTPGLLVVADPEHRATVFGAEQRAATAALIGALCAAPGFDPHSLVVQITGSPQPRTPGARSRPAPSADVPTSARVAPAQRSNSSAPGHLAAPAPSPGGRPAPAPSAHLPTSARVAPPQRSNSSAPGHLADAHAPALGQTPLAILTGPPAPAQFDTITLQAALDVPPRKVRALLRPYLGVIRVVFGNVRVTVRRPSLTIEFDAVRENTSSAAAPTALATPATPIGVRANKAPRQVR
ncbi:hypothetical protein BJQ94_02685 [Cryobacterium sp. SO2]|uniref:hypothetical protein n=1 Tax=Cryobacterium sp. SO2 TaxID=1897060 RepID=UPI00223E8276|nr:hypothetical protein [Cryobacterium sp. SO2]WEO77965.1 hypothetical protein BJQ94_02685 [Cryobacterium sp. SO2]